MSTADEQLAQEALAGSQRAYRELVHRFERPVFNLVARMVRDRTLAEDLTQDAFVKAFSRLDSYHPGQGKFSNWLFKIAHNTAIDHLRRSRLDTVPIDSGESEAADFHAILSDPDAPTPLDRRSRRTSSRALAAAVERLRPEYREVIVLRHQEGMAYEETADIARWVTVKTYIHRARKELAELLTGAGWGRAGGGSRNPRTPFLVGRPRRHR